MPDAQRLHQLVLIWIDDPEKFGRYLAALGPIVTRYGGAADRVFTPTAIHAETLTQPDVVNLVHYDDAAAYQRFTTDPDFLAIKPLRDSAVRMLSFDGVLDIDDPADDQQRRRIYGIEIVTYRDRSPAGYEHYTREGDPAMRPYGFHVDYTMGVTSHPDENPADLVRITSFPDPAARTRFESDPMHDTIENQLYPAAVSTVIWLDASLAP